jgi:2-dehydro-3-deoxyglucarate aldolase/4-hydroxy-2-oxoheptanedioate aldolase
METNTVKAKLKQSEWVSGPIVEEIFSVGGVRVLANAGHDFLWFDTEHNMYDWETLLTVVQFSRAIGIVPLVRVTDLSYPLVARALDTGALGVVIPRVDSREQVELAVQYAKYPPLGRRGAGGVARNAYLPKSAGEAIEWGNAETMVVVQIESPEVAARADEIASVPGIDVVCVGPQDLSINMGIPGKFDDPVFIETIAGVAQAAARHGVACGMVSRDASSFRRWYEVGCRFLVCNSDLSLLNQQASRDRQTLEEVTGGPS